MLNFGIVPPGKTLYIPFATYDSNDPSASVTLTGLAVTDIEVYKDGSVTQRASDAGYTLLDTDGIDFDATTGIHGFSISLADNTTAGFWAAGSQYFVVVASVTVDAATVNFIAARFEIGYPDANLNTTIATLASQTSFTLTVGPAEDDALNGCVCLIHDVASAVQLGYAVVSDYTGSTKTVTLTAGVSFTAAATDNISFFPPGNARWFAALATVALPLTPTTAGRTLDVSAGGEAGVDWANVGSPTTVVGLSGTTVKTATDVETDTADLQTQIGAAGAGLSAVPWNAAWDAEVQSEVEDGLVTHRLDELLNADSDIDGAAPPTVGSVFHELLTKTAGSFTYDQTTDSLEAIRDHVGDGTNLTEAGGTGDHLSALATQASVNTIDDFLDTEMAAVLAAVDTEVAAIKAVTDLLPDAGALSSLATAAALATVDTNVDDLKSGIIYGAAATGTLSTTQATTNLTGYANDQLIGRVLIVLSGAAEGEATDITDYVEVTGLLTFTALTTAMGNTDTFKIV